MDTGNRPKRAGGFLLAFAILAGAGVGVASHQPSIGVVGGTAMGLLLLAMIWFLDRR
jgi:hypothetical protein